MMFPTLLTRSDLRDVLQSLSSLEFISKGGANGFKTELFTIQLFKVTGKIDKLGLTISHDVDDVTSFLLILVFDFDFLGFFFGKEGNLSYVYVLP